MGEIEPVAWIAPEDLRRLHDDEWAVAEVSAYQAMHHGNAALYPQSAIDALQARIRELETALLGVESYRAKNLLGGPAKTFDAIADRIRGGEPAEDVMRDYGLRFDPSITGEGA